MAREPDNVVHGLLREILAKQEEHSGKLGLVETVAQSVAELHEDMRGMRSDVREVRADVQDLRAEVQDLRADVRSIRIELEVVHADSHDMRGEIHQMRGDIRDLQADSKEVRKVVGSHSQRFDFLDERVEMLREGTLTAIGFAANASESNKKVREQISDLTTRVEKLERGN
jgi:chromosome segregation ATPase